jgi:hypothetical protein
MKEKVLKYILWARIWFVEEIIKETCWNMSLNYALILKESLRKGVNTCTLSLELFLLKKVLRKGVEICSLGHGAYKKNIREKC